MTILANMKDKQNQFYICANCWGKQAKYTATSWMQIASTWKVYQHFASWSQ